MYYNKLLFSIYNEKDSLPICTTNHVELIVLEKDTVILDMLMNSKLKVINFCNLIYALWLEYNLFSVGIIEKVSNSILVKN